MKPVTRVGDNAHCPADGHGKDCCTHGVTGPATSGSPNVYANNKPVLRIGDPGVHGACCGPNTWVTSGGSSKVFANGIPVVRLGDATAHCGGGGTMVSSSSNIWVE